MKRAKLFVVVFSFLFLFCSCAGVYSPATVKKEITSTFKTLNVTEVKESEIPGIYEIYYTGTYPGIIYYYPPKKLLIFGEIWDVNGTSLTGLKLENYLLKLESEKTEPESLPESKTEQDTSR